MRPDEVEARKLEVRLERVLALYHVEAAKWQMLQAAVLAVLGLAYLSNFAGQLRGLALAGVVMLSTLLLAGSAWVLLGVREAFLKDTNHIMEDYDKLKEREEDGRHDGD